MDFHFGNPSARSVLAEVLSLFELLLRTAASFSYPLTVLLSASMIDYDSYEGDGDLRCR